ncbi:release factor glutamine methyltransferase [Nocardioides cavernae]|uniref:Release factor glutamine methyltransferase n=1 Tax=Nocardioides cavernae TaxID=1921566 RepID=A0A7Y9H2H9_9ACTN|nr:class I SAM-dependent methyltransferase [Nocardioides cavernae]NYE36772.1 release factor glutamine methyltransferase [Nocardioides cavernae]
MTEHIEFGPAPGSLDIAFDDRVLRPREWTAAQSAWAADLMATTPGGTVLELCAGAGHIGLLAVAANGRRLVCVDASPVACDYARVNAVANGLAERVEVRESRLEEALADDERFPVVIADPPWVPREQTTRYPQDPLTAIDGGDDGLDVARACLEVIDRHLAPGGSAVLQVGTRAQTDLLREEPCVAEGRLAMVEVRQHVRGVLARIDRA